MPPPKAQWSDPLEDHRGRGLCIDRKKPLYFLFEGLQLAWPCYRDPFGVGVYEELPHGFGIDMKGVGDSVFRESFMVEAVELENGVSTDHDLLPGIGQSVGG